VAVDIVADGHDELFEIAEGTAPDAFSVRSRQKRLIMFNYEAEVGVKCTWKHLVPVEPALNPGMLVGGVVVTDDMDLLFFGRHGLIDQAQKLQPL
jgi:hypothetical protein